jgi:hypothetical protein
MAEHIRLTRNRREFLTDAFCGIGSLAFASLCEAASKNPLAPKTPGNPAKAKSVIFLFMAGGPSHIETFDPKPLLNKLDGQKRPAEFGEAKYQFISGTAKLMGTKRTFKKYGQSGIEVSDLLPVMPIWWCTPPRNISCSPAAFFPASPAWDRGRFMASGTRANPFPHTS